MAIFFPATVAMHFTCDFFSEDLSLKVLGTRLRRGTPTMECGVFDEETKERLLNATLGHYAQQRFPTQGVLYLGNKLNAPYI